MAFVRQTPDPDITGMLPVTLKITEGRVVVNWIEASLNEFTDPFFHFTLSRLYKNGRRTLVTGTEVLDEFADGDAAGQIRGFIFHVSRCGSTLLSNSISLGTECLVFSEPGFFGPFLYPWESHRGGGPSYSPEKRVRLLKGMINALLRDNQSPVIIKNNCRDLLDTDTLFALAPAARSVFVFRDPVEVLASNFINPAGWLMFFRQPRIAAQLFPGFSEEMDEIIIATKGLELLMEAGKDLVQRGMAIGVDYAGLNLQRISKICDHFGLSRREGMMEKISQAMSIYAKDPDRNLPFIPDGQEKRLLLDEEIVNFIKDCTYSLFHLLRETQYTQGLKGADKC